jgi:mRNA interferase RelE/StbE
VAKVFLTEDAREDLRDLDNAARVVVVKAIAKLRLEPEKRGQPLGSKSAGDLTGLRKLVVGNRAYRIVYRVEADGSVCIIWVIGRRADSEVYELAMARLNNVSDRKFAKELGELVEATFAPGETTFERI